MIVEDSDGFVWKTVSKNECVRADGRLKMNCKHGRGEYKGKFLKRVNDPHGRMVARAHSRRSIGDTMTHPCASSHPPSWCNKKRKSKRRSTNGLSSVTAAQVAAHFKKHKVKISTKKACTVQSGKRKGKLKKGCFYGKGSLRGKILKKTR